MYIKKVLRFGVIAGVIALISSLGLRLPPNEGFALGMTMLILAGFLFCALVGITEKPEELLDFFTLKRLFWTVLAGGIGAISIKIFYHLSGGTS